MQKSKVLDSLSSLETGYSMASLDRKLQASAFVRRNSGKVAAELPQNQLAQLLHKSEMTDSAEEEIEYLQNSGGFDQYFGAYGSDRFEPKFCYDETI